ncbi:keratin-associated protein 19-2 isoform X1 [Hydra vulgaris]|uniref:keratin-associated protein 19-2 isoform X1 n=1 Tax=Hydra vulgaris TaxID=6087 RepID=UPI001F5E7760|nr:keratin-associated protein 19-2-like [Hydra vulgaris]XP_047138712.1 keratin-associated protein 19-2-like [Hydra vulgaris]
MDKINILFMVFLNLCVYARSGKILNLKNKGNEYGYGGYGGGLYNKGYGGYGGGLYNKGYGYGNNYYSDESKKDVKEDPTYNSYNKGYGFGGYGGGLYNKGYGGYGGGLNSKGYGYGNNYYSDESKKDVKEDPTYNSYNKGYGFGGYGSGLNNNGYGRYGGRLYNKGYGFGSNYNSDESKTAVKEDPTYNSYNKGYGYGGYGYGGSYNKGYGYGKSYFKDE